MSDASPSTSTERAETVPQIRLEPTSRHPVVLFFLGLLVVSSGTIAFGAPAPGSVNEQLPKWGVYLWAAALFFGAISILWGLKMQPLIGKSSVTGALLEEVGMAMLAAAGILYAVAAFATVGWSGVIPAGLVLGLSLACGYRAWKIREQVKAYLDRKAREARGNGEQQLGNPAPRRDPWWRRHLDRHLGNRSASQGRR